MSDSTLEQADSSNKLRGKASVKTFSFDQQLHTSESYSTIGRNLVEDALSLIHI